MRALLALFAAGLDAMWLADLSPTAGFLAAWTAWQRALRQLAVGAAGVAGDSPGRTGGWRARLAASLVGAPFDWIRIARSAVQPICPTSAISIHNDLLHFKRWSKMTDYRRAGPVARWPGPLMTWRGSVSGSCVSGLAVHRFCGGSAPPLCCHRPDVLGSDRRLLCYQLHIGLAGMAYQASSRRPPERLVETAQRIADVSPRSVRDWLKPTGSDFEVAKPVPSGYFQPFEAGRAQ